MAMAHIKMLIYDIKHLSSKDYNPEEQTPDTMNVLLVDNEATVAMAKNYNPTKKNRHIARRFHYVREGERTKEHHLKWIPATDQLADDMTKTQSKDIAQKHVERTMIELPQHLVEK